MTGFYPVLAILASLATINNFELVSIIRPQICNQNSAPATRAGDSEFASWNAFELVGVARFELTTTRTPSVCATRLRYTPPGSRGPEAAGQPLI